MVRYSSGSNRIELNNEPLLIIKGNLQQMIGCKVHFWYFIKFYLIEVQLPLTAIIVRDYFL